MRQQFELVYAMPRPHLGLRERSHGEGIRSSIALGRLAGAPIILYIKLYRLVGAYTIGRIGRPPCPWLLLVVSRDHTRIHIVRMPTMRCKTLGSSLVDINN